MKQIIISLMFTAVLFGCSKTNSSDTNQTQEKTKVAIMDEIKNQTDSTLVAIMVTSMGTIEIELYPHETPKTVENFAGLAQKGYYNGVIFHRVIDNFMIQGGDPTGTGHGGESLWGGRFEDEISQNLRHDVPGVLSMANAGPNTNGSQFFITIVPTPWLDGKHTVFGKVVNGLDVIFAIGKVPTSKPADKPLEDIVIKSVNIEKRAK